MHTLPVEDLTDIFHRLKEIWPQKKTFFITGGTGFFGRWFIESIAYLEQKLNTNNKFYILTRQEVEIVKNKIPVLMNSCFEVIQADLLSLKDLEFNFDYVIHAATDVSALKNSVSNLPDFSSVVDATKRLISVCENKKIEKILYISSGGVYANSLKGMKEEEFNHLNIEILKLNLTSYSNAKMHCEYLISEFSFRNVIDHCIARCFSFVGPYADSKMAVMHMLDKKRLNEAIVVNSPQVVRSYMYPTDLIVSLFRLLLTRTKYRVYNIGSDEAINLKDLAVSINQLKKPELQIETQIKDNNNSLAGKIYFPNLDRILNEFRSVITINLNEALKKTLNFETERENL